MLESPQLTLAIGILFFLIGAYLAFSFLIGLFQVIRRIFMPPIYPPPPYGYGTGYGNMHGYGNDLPMPETQMHDRSPSTLFKIVGIGIFIAFIAHTCDTEDFLGLSDKSSSKHSTNDRAKLGFPLDKLIDSTKLQEEPIIKNDNDTLEFVPYSYHEPPEIEIERSDQEIEELYLPEPPHPEIKLAPKEVFFIQMSAGNDYWKLRQDALNLAKASPENTFMIAEKRNGTVCSMCFKLILGVFDSEEEATTYLNDNPDFFIDGGWVQPSTKFHELYSLPE